MKTAALVIVAAAVSLSASFSRATANKPFTPELAGIATLYVPADDDAYEIGAGFGLQARLWLNSYIGLAVAAGGASYAIDERDTTLQVGDQVLRADLEGDVGLAPIGLSLLLRPVSLERFALTLEGGVRYVAVDSDVELEVESAGPSRYTFIRDTVDIEDGIVAVAAVQLQYQIAKQVSLMVGGGYQFDLQKGDVEFMDRDLGENELEAALVEAGLIVRF